MNSLQVIQNKVARVVMMMSWSTPTRELLAACGWLSVRQLAMYHTVLVVHKVLQVGSPLYIANMFCTEYRRNTRQAAEGYIKPSRDSLAPRTEIVASSFQHRAVQQYNMLTAETRNVTSIKQFKYLARNWIMVNVPVE